MEASKIDTGPVDTTSGEWVKHSRYELRAGCICPAPGSKLQRYSPWLQFNAAKNNEDKPYQSLIALVRHLRDRQGDEEQREQPVMDWCQKYGLLGVLPFVTGSMNLAPMIVKSGRFDELRDTEYQRLHKVQITFARHGRQWARIVRPLWANKQVSGGNGRRKLLRSAILQRPGAEILSLRTGTWQSEPLGYTWARFFPDVNSDEAERADYPMPDTAAFWARYCEPLASFISAAEFFADTIGLLRQGDSIGEKRLNLLLHPVGPIYRRSGSRATSTEISLLSAFAAMVYANLRGGSRVIRCPGCGEPFLSNNDRQTFCGPRCKSKMAKRRLRQKKGLLRK